MTRIALLVPVCALLASAADRITFSETIAPIVYQNCVTCHRAGEAAPFPLISYDDVRKRGALIATVTQSRYMPPWHAAHGFGEFADERRLDEKQIAAIAEWVKQGMPEGDRSKMPKLPQFVDGWHLGKPDLILEMPAACEEQRLHRADAFSPHRKSRDRARHHRHLLRRKSSGAKADEH